MAHPADQTWRANILPRELRRQAEFLARLSENLAQTGDFPTDTPAKLCRLISATAGTLGDALARAPTDQLRLVNEFFRELTTHLRYADRSRLSETPWSMVQATEAFLKQQIGSNAHFIIRPQWNYNYGLISEFVAVYRYRLAALGWIDVTGWEKRIGHLSTDRIYCISFPRLERLNALLHTCWGHEVGHILAQDWTQRQFNAFWLAIEGTVTAACKSELQKQKSPTQDYLFWDVVVNQQVADWTKHALQIARFGINELISDAVGLHLFGPAAFAASAEICAHWELDVSPLNGGHYPPWRYRLQLLAETCRADLARFKPDGPIDPGPELQPFVSWLRETSAISTVGDAVKVIQSDARTRETYNAIQREWPLIRAEALKSLPGPSQAPYLISDRVDAVRELVLKLEGAIPPNEVGRWPNCRPAALADILNAAWAFKIKKISEDPSWGAADEYEELFRLVLKAVEAAHVHSTFGPLLDASTP